MFIYLLPEMEPLHTWLILSELKWIERISKCAETARVQKYSWEAEILGDQTLCSIGTTLDVENAVWNSQTQDPEFLIQIKFMFWPNSLLGFAKIINLND